MDMDCDQYKLFVGGLPRGTSEESLKQHFSRYGAVLGASVAKEKATGQPRGFAFVRFSNACDVDKALSDSHYILGRAVDVKKAIPKHGQMRQPPNVQPYPSEVQQNNGGGVHEMLSNGNNNNHRTKKLFVGGLSSETTQEEFRTYFEKFGRTTDVVVMHDSTTNRPRGFGFVTYDSENSVEIVMQSSFHELSNKRVEVKRAIPKEAIQISNGGNHRLPPTYNNSFQTTPYVHVRNGYEITAQYPPVFAYHHGFQGFHYPYGYPVTAQGPNVPWNNLIMPPPTPGFYSPPPPLPPTNTHCYLPYMNGFDLAGMTVTAFNVVPWPVAGDGAVALLPRLEDLKLEVPSQAHKRMNGGNLGKPLPNGTYR